jgi:TonB family protein
MTKQTVRFAVLASAVVGVATVSGTGMMMTAGCAADSGAREASADKPMKRRRAGRAGQAGSFESSAGASEMTLENEVGVYDGKDLDAALGEHKDEIRDCYERAGKAQRYAGGQVTLRFLVGGDGTPGDVLVIASDLGNYDVERCLVETGRRIKFPAPDGRKATTFEYPVEFRSTNQLAVLDADGLKVDHDLSVFLPQLAACGQLAANDANAIMYIEPNGFPGSVGLAAGSTLDEDVGDCMVQTIRGWKMSATLPGHVMRATFNIPPVIATALATPRRAGAHRRRH